MAPQLRVDQSVSVDGACQTVVAADEDSFSVVSIEETLSKTNLGTLKPGDPVNLERALLPSARLDGHFVQGHVDATGEITEVETLETSHLYTVRFAAPFARYLIPVGSVTLDGISLTVARLDGSELSVAIIPYTYEHTTVARRWQAGAAVNIEFDIIGKYIARNLAMDREETRTA